MDILRELADERKDAIADMKRRLDDAEERAKKSEERLHQAHEEARTEREKLMLFIEHRPADKIETGRDLIPTPEPQQATRRSWWQREKKVKA